MNCLGIVKELRKKRDKAEIDYLTLKNNILDGVSVDIRKDFEDMNNKYWEFERIVQVLMQKEISDRDMLYNLHGDLLDDDPSEEISPDELLKG